MPPSTSPENSRAEQAALWALRVGVAAQAVGLALTAWRRRTALEGALFLDADWPEVVSRAVDLGAAGLGLLAALVVLARPHRLAALWIALWSLAIMSASWLQGLSYFEGLTPFAWAIRLGAPMALTLALWPGGRVSEGRIAWLARVACATTFAAHGVEALRHHPKFIDLILGAALRVSQDIPQLWAERMLDVIGVVDVLVAALMLTGKRWRWLAGWMALWGAITALSRVVLWGVGGVDLALVRANHAALPLALLLLWGAGEMKQTSLSSNDSTRDA